MLKKWEGFKSGFKKHLCLSRKMVQSFENVKVIWTKSNINKIFFSIWIWKMTMFFKPSFVRFKLKWNIESTMKFDQISLLFWKIYCNSRQEYRQLFSLIDKLTQSLCWDIISMQWLEIFILRSSLSFFSLSLFLVVSFTFLPFTLFFLFWFSIFASFRIFRLVKKQHIAEVSFKLIKMK